MTKLSRVMVRYEDVPKELKHLLTEEGYEEIYEGDEMHLMQTYSLPEIINLTPHAINVIGVMEIPESGLVARVAMRTEMAGQIAGVPVSRTEYGQVENLPKIKFVFFIVSQMVRAAVPDRDDLLYPSELVRDEKGNIVGCKSLGI